MLEIDLNEKVMIGVSGGPDSMFLLNELLKKGYQKIIVCHVNYDVRPTAFRDQKIVEDFCSKHQLKYYCKKAFGMFQTGNFEETARLIRYDFFAEVGKIEGTKLLLIAHNLNDHIETYCLQKQRHNLVDYYGLKPISHYHQLSIFRPLLTIKKTTILETLKAQSIPFGIDETNQDLSYARNFIRAELTEDTFPNYLVEINRANQINEHNKKIALEYFKSHLIDYQLSLDSSFYELELEQVMFLLINYWSSLNLERIFLKRKNNTLKAIAKTLLTSQKPVLRIKVQNYFCIKDFNRFYLLEAEDLVPKQVQVQTMEQVINLTFGKTKTDFKKIIANDGYQFPYIITNDFENYKTKTFCGTKKTNRFFINHKISYAQRLDNPAIIRVKNKQIINYQKFLEE